MRANLVIFIISISLLFMYIFSEGLLLIPEKKDQISDLVTNTYVVSSVVDGDTIKLSNGEKLRYIGIDTPETKDPNTTVECYAEESYRKNRELVEGKLVEIEKDISQKDKYGRLLRYVYIDGIMINELLVREGYAKVSSYPPDIKYQSELKAAEQEARNAKKGLWGEICAKPNFEQDVIATTIPVSTSFSSKSCKFSCFEPDKDCADFSSQIEAQEFFECCGFTAQYDPMNLDGKNIGDGIACEGI